MLCKHSYNLDVKLSQCDFSGKLGIAQCFDLFSDASTRHTDLLGIGLNELHKDGRFWMVTKTVIKINRMPALSDDVTLCTWPSKPSHITYERNYTVKSGEELLVCGKSEWSCISFDTGKFSRLNSLFSSEYEYPEEKAVPEAFEKIEDEGFSEEPFAKHLICLTDLDMNRHMNNARYAYAVMDTFSSEELKAHPIKSVEILYKAQAKEGDVLEFTKRNNEDGSLDIRAKVGQTVVMDARIRR